MILIVVGNRESDPEDELAAIYYHYILFRGSYKL